MAERLKVVCDNSDAPSSVSGLHMVEEETWTPHIVFLTSTNALCNVHAFTHTHKINNFSLHIKDEKKQNVIIPMR